MRVSELRIGNYITGISFDYEDNAIESECCVLGLDITQSLGYGWSIMVDSKDDIDEFESFKPIPLTEEWLIKFGFERVTPMGSTYDNNYAYELKDWGRIALKNGVLVSDQYYFLDGLCFDIKHVHQLQNLYFTLTGKELTIKE